MLILALAPIFNNMSRTFFVADEGSRKVWIPGLIDTGWHGIQKL